MVVRPRQVPGGPGSSPRAGPWPTVQPTDAASRRPQRVHIHTQTYDAKSGSGLRRTGAISALSRRLVGRNKPSRLRLRLSVRKVTIRGMAAVRLAARLIKRPRPSGGLRAGAVNLDGGFLPPKGESGGSPTPSDRSCSVRNPWLARFSVPVEIRSRDVVAALVISAVNQHATHAG